MPLQRREDGGRPPCNCRDGIVIPTKIGAAGAGPHRAPRDDNDDDCRDGTTRTRTTEMEWAADHKIGWRARSGRVGYLPYHNSGNGRSRQRRRKQRQRRGQTTINQKAAEIGAETAVVAAATAAAVAAAAAAATTAPTAAEAASEVDGHLTQ